MESPTLLFKRSIPLEYDIVVEKFNYARIIIYIDQGDEVIIRYDKNDLYVDVLNYETLQSLYLHVKLGFRINRVNYRVKNGILTLEIKGKRFLII